MDPFEGQKPRLQSSLNLGLNSAIGLHSDVFEDFSFASKLERRSWIRIAVLIGWIAIVGLQISDHVMWRDEVRPLSIALQGDNLLAMLTGLHEERHPALWYVLLRGAYAVTGRVEVLQGLAVLTALLTVILLVWRSPFPLALIILILTGHCFLFDFPVMARNYGISALLLFMIAACYQSWRDRGYVLGLLLFLLANTNVFAAIIVGAFLLFWLLDLIEGTGLRWTPQLRTFVANAMIATAGIAVCAVTILPTYNDAGTYSISMASLAKATLKAIMNPAGTAFGSLLGYGSLVGTLGFFGSLVLFGSTLGLVRRPSAFIAALAGLVGCAIFFGVVGSGAYRHAVVWLSFVIALYWICWRDIVGKSPGRTPAAGTLGVVGLVTFLLLLGAQSARSVMLLARPEIIEPRSRSADLGRLIASRPDLAKAVIVAEPEFMAEPLPYYIPNRIYLIREHRYGNVVRFSYPGFTYRSGQFQLDTDLGETLRTSRGLRRSTGEPVVIVLSHRLDQIRPGQLVQEGPNWTFSASAEQIHEFLDATSLLHRFGPARSDETYDVYLLK
jgi:hypothetical protein